MSFTIFVYSTTAYADEVNNNFYHVAQGNLIPRDGPSLTAIDSTQNLGNTNSTWNYLYTQNLNIYGTLTSSGKRHYGILYENIVQSNTTRIEITGLTYSRFPLYIYVQSSIAATTSSLILLHPNGDTTSNYNKQSIRLTASTLSGTRTTQTTINLGYANSVASSFSYSVFFSPEETINTQYMFCNTVICDRIIENTGSATSYNNDFYSYGNAVSVGPSISSIVITANGALATGASIKILARN